MTAEERAEICVRCIVDLNIPIPAIIDTEDDATNLAYGAHPDRLYLVGRDGRIAYAGGQGPFGFSPDELEKAIQVELKKPTTTAASAKVSKTDPRLNIPLMAALDTDGDGSLSATEIAAASAMLKKLDKDGDGQLSPKELAGPPARPAPPADDKLPTRGGGTAAMMLERMDANKDGKLSKAELPERMQSRFTIMDANKDGVLDTEELESMAGRMRRGGSGGRGSGGEGRGGSGPGAGRTRGGGGDSGAGSGGGGDR